MVKLQSVMLRLRDTLHDFRSVQTYPRLKKIAGKIVSVQRLELGPRRSKGIRYIFSNIQDSCLLQGHMAGFK